MKKIIVAILAVVVVWAGALFVFGQTTEGTEGTEATKGKRWGKRGGHHGARMHRRGGGMMFRGLDLTEDQKAQMKQLREASKATTAPLREAMKANRQKLAAATADGAFDEAQVNAIANENAQIMAQMMVQRLKVKSQMEALLTAEQKAKIAERKAKMKERFQEFRNKRQAKKADGGAE